MAAFFLDSSALVKRYTTETGSQWILSLVRPSAQNSLYVARITGAEVVAALARKRKGKRISPPDAAKAINRFTRHFARRYLKVNISNILLESAMLLADKHELRGYDAVQLAAALEVEATRRLVGAPPLTLLSADADLNRAAQNEGLLVDNPAAHP